MNLEPLQDRLQQLERRVRFLRFCVLLAALLGGVCAFAGMAPLYSRVLEAETLILSDSAGRPRGVFSAGNDEPFFLMIDSKGMKRLRFRIEDKGPTVSLYDANQNLRLQMSGSGDFPEVLLLNEIGKETVRIRGTHDEPQIVIFDSDGHSRARLFVLDGEKSLGSGVSLVNEDGEQKVLMTALPDGTCVIRAGAEVLAPANIKPTAKRPATAK